MWIFQALASRIGFIEWILLGGGGVGIFAASILAGFVSSLGWFFVLCAMLAFASGALEDYTGKLSPKTRLAMQVLSAALAIYLLNAVIFDVGLNFQLPYALAVIFTVFAITGATNAINIIDGFNGLASGIALMVLFSISFAAWAVQDLDVFYIAVLLMAAILGFFVLNFPRGKIFLGDGGAYFIGFSIVVLSILLSERNPQISPWFLLGIMIYPIYEVLFSMYRKKILRGISPTLPDKTHMHMLIYKRRTKTNAKTSVFLIAVNAPFIILPAFYFDNEKLLILTIIFFVVSYNFYYYGLINFRAGKKGKNQV